jgi:hypothetical protein
MFKRLSFAAFVFLLSQNVIAQDIFYKNPTKNLVMNCQDSAKRVKLKNIDSNDILRNQFNYVLKFYPKMLVKNIVVDYNVSSKVVNTRPTFSSIFLPPNQRVYKISFSKKTKSTMDSVLLQNLTFNSQLGLIAHQVSTIEDYSTSGIFYMLGWYFKLHTRANKKRHYLETEEKTLELGLGYQLLSLNRETAERLKIEHWVNTKNYAEYLKYQKNLPMRPDMVLNFINDLPVYVNNQYK